MCINYLITNHNSLRTDKSIDQCREDGMNNQILQLLTQSTGEKCSSIGRTKKQKTLKNEVVKQTCQ